MSATWVLVDCHQCNRCGHLDTDKDGMMEHLSLHDREARPDDVPGSRTSEHEAKAREAEAMLPRVGEVWEWEPLKPHARQTVTVTEVKWNGDEWWIETEGRGGRHWNSVSRWVEATVLVTPAEDVPRTQRPPDERRGA